MRSILKSDLAVLGLYFFMAGITVSSFLFGAQSIEYYLFIGIGFVVSVPFLLWQLRRRKKILSGVIILALAPILMFGLHALFLYNSADEDSLWPHYLGISAAIILASVAGLLSITDFRRLMSFVAITHLVVCIYGLMHWDIVAAAQRFSAFGLGTAVWAEIALGAIISALLTRNKWLIICTSVFAGAIIYGAQMRGAGVAALFALLFYAFQILDRRAKLILVIFVGPLIYFFLFNRTLETAGQLLLLNDPHRGLGSGFSGRFDNWRDGVNRFIDSPIIGVGLYDPMASHTHNGYLKILSQFGIVFSVLMMAILYRSFMRAWKLGYPESAAAILGYMLFIVSAPRYINLQLMPFVSLAAIAFIMMRRPNPSTPSRTEDTRDWFRLSTQRRNGDAI